MVALNSVLQLFKHVSLEPSQIMFSKGTFLKECFWCSWKRLYPYSNGAKSFLKGIWLLFQSRALSLWTKKNWCFWTVVLEKTLENALDCKEIQQQISPDWLFIGRWTFNTLATWCKELTDLQRPWCWEGLRAEGEGDNRGGDGWMASPTQCTRVWVDSSSSWWIGRPGVLQFMGSQWVGHDWATELNWSGH